MHLNYLGIVSESVGVLISYVMICMQDMRYGPEQSKEIGSCIVLLIYLLLVINVASFAVDAAYGLRLRVKYCYYNQKQLKKKALKLVKCRKSK